MAQYFLPIIAHIQYTPPYIWTECKTGEEVDRFWYLIHMLFIKQRSGEMPSDLAREKNQQHSAMLGMPLIRNRLCFVPLFFLQALTNYLTTVGRQLNSRMKPSNGSVLVGLQMSIYFSWRISFYFCAPVPFGCKIPWFVLRFIRSHFFIPKSRVTLLTLLPD